MNLEREGVLRHWSLCANKVGEKVDGPSGRAPWESEPSGVSIRAVEKVLPIHKAQLLSYMKLLDVPVGLLINFHELKVTDGTSRLVLAGANG